MTKKRTGLLVGLSLILVARATAFAGQARGALLHARSSAQGKDVEPAAPFHHGPGGCQDTGYDGMDL